MMCVCVLIRVLKLQETNLAKPISRFFGGKHKVQCIEKALNSSVDGAVIFKVSRVTVVGVLPRADLTTMNQSGGEHE